MIERVGRAVAFLLALLIGAGEPASAQTLNPVRVGFDGAYAVKNSTSASAIELGIRAAIFEINAANGVLGGRPLELVISDNRSVPSRGVANFKKFAEETDLVAVFGDRFSPVILEQVPFANDLKLPLISVWGAADGITDNANADNYSFRLSLRDSWAMPFMLKFAAERGIRKVGVLLPNTGWGRSNDRALKATSGSVDGIEVVGTVWYNWGEQDMLGHYNAVLKTGAEGMLFVANDIEAAQLMRQLNQHPDRPRLPIVSHWGVAGGDMVTASGPALQAMDFSVIQTFSFANPPRPRLAKFRETLRAMTLSDDVEKLESPVGVGQAYDMMHILALAIDKAGSTDRPAIRKALTDNISFDGLVRLYHPAFSSGNHDALTEQQLFMAKFLPDGRIVPIAR